METKGEYSVDEFEDLLDEAMNAARSDAEACEWGSGREDTATPRAAVLAAYDEQVTRAEQLATAAQSLINNIPDVTLDEWAYSIGHTNAACIRRSRDELAALVKGAK